MSELRSLNARAAGTRVLLIDNYSSFTFNLYQYLAELTGVLPVVVRNDASEALVLEQFDAVVLSPGPGTPERDRDFGICRAMLAQEQLPVLGVCLGHQGIGVAAGAVLAAASEPFHGRASTVVHSGGPLFEGIPERFQAIRYHSLLLQEPLPASLECIARTEDGQVMALRHRERRQWGVQFHPESVATEYGRTLLANFCALCGKGEVLAMPAVQVAVKALRCRWRLHSRSLPIKVDAEEVFASLFGDAAQSFWLDGTATSAHSYMGDDRGQHSYTVRYDQAQQAVGYTGARNGSQPCKSIFALLEAELSDNQIERELSAFAFAGGFVGYFGYELRADLGSATRHRSDLPDAHWTWVQRFVAYDHETQQATLCMLLPDDASEAEAQVWFQEAESKLDASAALPTLPQPGAAFVASMRDSKAQYEEKIAACLEHIARGESYELCLTTQLSAVVPVDPFQLYRVMRSQNPAPYAAFLRCGAFAIASASPERFLKVDAERWVESKPIKGTARRDPDPRLDRGLAESLRASEKERAENLMIVDLVRNDLGRSCEVGSVVVKELSAVESYATLHHLVSTIGGRLREGVSSLQCVRDAFPGGSMTGAPKLRSMEILDALESGARGPYAGSIGYLGCNGAIDLSIVIRSVVVQGEVVRLGVGGAITALSESGSEFEEVQLKASAQLRALGSL